MKTLKIALTALVIAGGTFTAFAFSANNDKENKVATTYYAIEDSPGSSSYHWSTSIPSNFKCKPGNAVCSLQADTPPRDNQLPSGVSPTNMVYRLDTEE
ncbi:hypothetical protein [Chryseobacterium gleum]|uniref:hypothetical protein n=1 Tax=Chryseobacterium gleum TaxID=250 RepID=UPI00241CF3EA|nr:hypothetical protein [Chryseobacterium gleum]